MNRKSERTLQILNSLLENCMQAEESYRNAADQTRDDNLKQIFIIHSYQKAEYAAKLRSEIKRLGGDVGLFKYSDKYSFTEDDPNFLLDACETREASAVQNYQIAMNEDILWEVIPIVSSQYLETKESYNQIKFLKKNLKETYLHV